MAHLWAWADDGTMLRVLAQDTRLPALSGVRKTEGRSRSSLIRHQRTEDRRLITSSVYASFLSRSRLPLDIGQNHASRGAGESRRITAARQPCKPATTAASHWRERGYG